MLGGKEGGQALLPIVVQALDFAFGLWGGSVAQRDVVKAQSGAELGEDLGLVREEKRMVIDVEREWAAAAQKGARKEVEVGEEVLATVEPRERHQPAVIVDDLQERQRLVPLRKPAVRRSIVLPELTDLLHLPASDRLARLLVPG